MNFQSISNIFEPIAYEARSFKNYSQRRVKDITAFIKKEKLLSLVLFADVAFIVYKVTVLIFAFPIIIACDYLHNTLKRQITIDKVAKPFSWLFIQSIYKGIDLSEHINKETKNINSSKELLKKVTDNNEREYFESAIADREKHLFSLKEYEKRPAIVFIQAMADHNGALNLEKLHYFKFKDNPNGVDDLLKKYRIVVLKESTSINHINEQIQKIPNKIEQVWILAHGNNGDSLELSETNYINKKNAYLLTEILEKNLVSDANIVLYSCSAGKTLNNEKNIAATISKLLPGRIVWAPQTNLRGKLIIDLKGKEMKIRFWHYRTQLEYIMKKLFYVLTFRFKTPVPGKYNVTVSYRNGEAYNAN